MPYGNQDNLYTFNKYLDNKDNLGTKSLEAHSCSKEFLSKIFQKGWKSIYSNENLDKFIYNLELDKLEKLLQPARLIEPHNITCMLPNTSYMIDLDVLADILKVLILNIDILQTLYDLNIPFSFISGKFSRMGSYAKDCMEIIFTILKKNRELQKNSKDFVSCFETLEQKLHLVKNKKHETRIKVINSMIKEYINIQETNNDNDEKITEIVPELPNNLTINNNQSQIIDKHREDDIETNSDEINTHSDSQKLDISDSELEAIHRMDEMILLNSKSGYANQSQPIENYIDVYLEDGDLAKNSDAINTHSDSQKLDISDSELEAIHRMDEMILLNSKSGYANQSQPIENYIDVYLEDGDLAKNSDAINTHSDSQKLDISDSELEAIHRMDEMILLNSKSGYANQSQPIENYIDVYLEDGDLAKNSDAINTHSDSQKLDISDSELEAIHRMDEMILLNSKSGYANQSQPIENYIDVYLEDGDLAKNSDAINTHSDSQKLDISDSELEAIHRMDEMILLNSKSGYANQSQPIENYIDVYLEDGDLAKNSDAINTHSDSQKLDISDSELEAIHRMDEMILLNSKSGYANQSQPIENYIDVYLEDGDLAKNSDAINTHSDSQKLDISDSELEAIHRMDEMILLNSKSGYANQSQPIENYIDVYLEDGDLAKNSDAINTHSDSQKLAANISNSAPTTNEILNSMLAIDDNDIKIELELDNWMTNQFGNQSQIDDIKNSSNEINTSDPELDDILELVLDMYDIARTYEIGT
ncbi:repeat-containing protein D [Orientia tsutsugamushi str. Gilliam]|uniref:Repeat-containing protein D n=1 Tax=Orientia tsutsugamushi str. Gilliam TaxID=1359184 RepID=A0A2U3QPP0_ORITS|nr:hypothetical protein [Orientia tsutsugamushi]SPR02908.1 repeat-containing protein D [Orientia tsutsugamushi str. Gilliam]